MRQTLLKFKSIWRQHSVPIVIAVMFALAIVVIALQAGQVKRYHRENLQYEHNQAALQDSVRLEYNKRKEAEYNKTVYIVSSPKEILELNKELHDELLKLKGEVKSIQKAAAVIVHDTVPLIVEQKTPFQWNFSFDTAYDDKNYERFSGIINTQDPSLSKRTRSEFGIGLTTGIKEVDGKPTIFVTSKYPNFKITELQGAIVDKKYFNTKGSDAPLLSVSANVGQNLFTYHYSGQDKGKLNFFQPQVNGTVGVSVNINKLLKKK